MACEKVCVKKINVYGSTDYGQPIFPNFCDYRTSTGRGMRFMSNPPHNPISLRNCPVSKIPSVCKSSRKLGRTKTLFEKKLEENSTCQNEYTKSGVAKVSRQEIGPRAGEIHYIRRLKERVFDDPPRPIYNLVTENQCHYNYHKLDKKPQTAQKTLLNIESEPADPSFYFRSFTPGYSRYLDPYSTTTELTYIPYTQTAQNGIAKKDIITFYDVLNVPKGSRGFGPRVSTHLMPNSFDPVYDKLTFKSKCWNRVVPFSKQRVPNFGITTEFRSNYRTPTGKQFDSGTVEAPPIHQTPWQDLSPPYMYCTDYCHIAHKTPVDCAVDVYKHRKTA